MAYSEAGSEWSAERRFTVAEYHRMAETGILSPDERVELICGTLRKMSPKNRGHVVAIRRAFELFYEMLKGRASVYTEAPLRLEGLHSEPEPDLLVCSNPDFETYGTEATSPLLVVEVADSSLCADLVEKASLYARGQVPEYWVVNLVERVLVVFREPRDGTYQLCSTLAPGARVTPLSWPDLDVEVASLFPDRT